MGMEKEKRLEKILWSIALPGFGQILNGKLFKGLLFIVLEVIINLKSNINQIVILSFNGKTLEAVDVTNYQWLMFYPCVYIFAIWDAYRDSGGKDIPYAFLPFVFSAYLGTIGVIYSSRIRIDNVLFGPVWLPIGFFILGVLLGAIFRHYLMSFKR